MLFCVFTPKFYINFTCPSVRVLYLLAHPDFILQDIIHIFFLLLIFVFICLSLFLIPNSVVAFSFIRYLTVQRQFYLKFDFTVIRIG